MLYMSLNANTKPGSSPTDCRRLARSGSRSSSLTVNPYRRVSTYNA